MGWTWGSLSSALKLPDLIAQLNRRGKTLEGALSTLTTAVSDAGGQAQPIGPDTLIDNVPAATVVSPSGTSFLEPFDDLPVWTRNTGNGVLSVVEGAGETGGKVLRAVGFAWYIFPYNLAFDPSKLYRIRCRVRMTLAPTDPATDDFFCGVEGIAADGVTLVNVLGQNSTGSQHYVAASAKDMGTFTLGEFQTFTGWFKGHGAYVPNASNALNPSGLNAGVRYIRPLFILNYSNGDGTMELDYIAIDVFDEDGQSRLYTALDVSGNTLNLGGQDAATVLANISDAQAQAAQAISDAAGAQATADGKVVTFFAASTSAPAAEGVGDLWIVTDQGNALKRWDGSAWVDVRDTGIAQAISAAADAQSTADSKIVTFFQTTTPAGATVGDLWIDTDDDNHPYRWNGSVWVDARDGTIAIAQAAADAAQAHADSALAAAQDAQASADGKVTTFFQAAAPTAEAVGDLWVDTDDSNHLYRWSGSAWVSVKDGGIQQAIDAASLAQSTADGKIVTFYQTTAPAADGVGDLWVDTDDGNHLYRWDGSAWVDVRDTTIAQALAAAQNAQAAADGKIQTFYQTAAPPSAGLGVGDLWIDTDDSNKLYRWSGSAWVLARDAGIAQAITDAAGAQATADGKVTTFYAASTAPPTPEGTGDLWYQTDTGSLERWNGVAWQLVGDVTASHTAADTQRVSGLDALIIAGKVAGTQVNPNPEFAGGSLSNYGVYDNNSTGLVVLSAVADDTAPNRTGWTMHVARAAGSGTTPGLGGFKLQYPLAAGALTAGTYRKGSTIIHRILAKIPVGASIQWASNAFGTEGTHTWLTSRAGTGAWTWYISKQVIGTTGTFSTTGFWYLDTGSPPVDWDVAVCDWLDITSAVTIFETSIVVPNLAAISADIGTIGAGVLQDSLAAPTAAIRLDAASALPAVSRFLDLAASGTNPFLQHDKLKLAADGTALLVGVDADTVAAGGQRADTYIDDDGTMYVPVATTINIGERGGPGTRTKTLHLPAVFLRPQSPTDFGVASYGGWGVESGDASLFVNLRGAFLLPLGAQMTAIRLRAWRSTASSQALLQLFSADDSGTETHILTLTHTTTGWQTISQVLSETMQTGKTYHLVANVSPNATGRILWVEIDYTVDDYITSL